MMKYISGPRLRAFFLYFVNVVAVNNISSVVVQGGGAFDTFVSSFYLQLSADGRRWYTYQELPTDARPRAKMFQGNSDDSTAVENRLQRMVSAHYVRILPHDFQNGIYLRAELLGCGGTVTARLSQHHTVKYRISSHARTVHESQQMQCCVIYKAQCRGPER
ncbi:SCO-spondin [Acipenser ruthenus]|uniref:SCO-spondin n=1 Tax=Acipenser ruthenus TaxID=7906 RepID=A0A444U5Y1_ACIRT|nr:SCO-spondin [Acipenser ruthenus]